MKQRFLFLVTLAVFAMAFTATNLYAQNKKGTVHAVSRQDMLTKLPKDVAYWLSEFSMGRMVFNDGSSKEGLLNVCVVDNSVRFINDKSDTLVLFNSKDVERIFINDSLLVQKEDRFYREVACYGSVILAEQRIFNFSEPEVEASSSMGGLPPTSMAKKTNMQLVDNDRVYEFEADIPWNLSISYVLIDGDKIYNAKRSSFEKIFADKKDFIRTFVKSNKTDFDSKEDVISLFWYCTEN